MSTDDARIELMAGAVNTWIVGDDDEVIVIDPGTDAAAVLAAVGDREILAVICTHGHPAHAGAAPEVAGRDDAPMALHPGDRLDWRETHEADPDIEMDDGGRFEVAGVILEVLHAPGHSPGSVLLYSDELQAAFTGDVVTRDGPVPGADGFPDWARQLHAIGTAVLTLPSASRLLPGHGGELTVAIADQRFDAWASAGPERIVGGSGQDDE